MNAAEPDRRMRDATELDRRMFRHAAQRGLVRIDDGRVAVLIAWRPARNRTKARVEFASGNAATIPALRVVELVEETADA